MSEAKSGGFDPVGWITDSTIWKSGKSSIGSVVDGFSKGGLFGGLQAISNVFKPEKVESEFGAPFDLSSFRASFDQGKKHSTSIARNNLFNVMVKTPPLMFGRAISNEWLIKTQQSLCFRIEAIELPSRAIATVDARTYGPVRKIPYGTPMYNEITLSIITNEALDERQFFMNWMDLIQIGSTASTAHDGDVSYFEQIVTDIEIRVFDADGVSPRCIVTLRDAYPVSIEPVQLAWADNNSYMRHVVRFCYHTFYEKYPEKGEKKRPGGFLNQLKDFRDNIREVVTDIRNFKTTWKNQKESLKSIKDNLSRQWGDAKDSGSILDKMSVLSSAPDLIAGGIGDSAFKLLDRSNGSSLTSIGEKAWNYTKSFF